MGKLLAVSNLTIPTYQRPYKWTTTNVHQLFQDIQLQKQRSAYRLGTIVFHRERDEKDFNIVDGQQRTLTLVLIVYAIIEVRSRKLERQDLSDQLKALTKPIAKFMNSQKFESEISKRNLHLNYVEAKRIISRSEFTEQHIDFLLNKCEVVVFTLNDISEAFQFFDSQNARGRDLEPHDLLKAYHLREFSEHEEYLKASSVAAWEALGSDELAALFAKYLYRIRRWALGYSARNFGKKEVGLFKGVNIDKVVQFPYLESLRITHFYVDDYNSQHHRKIDGHYMKFPFHIDQIIINGRRFFEMAAHYQNQIQAIVKAEVGGLEYFLSISLSDQAQNIIKELNEYPDRNRTGDKYVRSIFDCALVFYMDKFGSVEISSAIEKIFIWAYQLRIRNQVVQLASMDNHVLTDNIFQLIKDATSPSDIISLKLPLLSAEDANNNKRKGNADKDPLVKLFKGMNYYE